MEDTMKYLTTLYINNNEVALDFVNMLSDKTRFGIIPEVFFGEYNVDPEVIQAFNDARCEFLKHTDISSYGDPNDDVDDFYDPELLNISSSSSLESVTTSDNKNEVTVIKFNEDDNQTTTKLPTATTTKVSTTTINNNESIKRKVNLESLFADDIPELPTLPLNSQFPTVPSTENSYKLGKLGEKGLFEMLKECSDGMIVTHVGTTGHVGDIHVDDEINNIKYVVECKLKKRIDKNDLKKFKDDMHTITEMSEGMYVYGIFVSLNTDVIPTIGVTKCDKNAVYITQNLVTKDVFKLIFSMVPTYINSLCTIENEMNNINNNNERQIVEYQVPLKVRQMLATLQTFNNDLTEELNIINTIRNNAISTTNEVTKLQTKYLIRRNFVLDINLELSKSGLEEFTTASIVGGNNGTSSLDNDPEFLEFMRTAKRSKITKKELKNKFPNHITEIASMKLSDLLKYCPK